MFQGKTLYQVINQVAKEYPNGLALYYKKTKISYKKFLKLIDQTADILYNVLGVRKDDVVLVSQPNMPEVVILFYAINKIGAVSNMVHPFTPFNQINDIMNKTNSKVAILFEQRIAKEVEKYREIADKIYITRVENYLPFFTKLIYHTFMNNKIRKKLGKSFKFNGFNYYHKLKPTGKPVPVNTDCDKLSVLLHSGSTTGDPKTICLSDLPFNYIGDHGEDFICMPVEQLKGAGMLSVLPSFHGFGLEMTMHLPLVNKMPCVLIPKFTPKEVTTALNDTKFKVICGVPTLYDKLFHDKKFVNSKNFKKIIVCWSGGDAISSRLIDYCNEQFSSRGSKGVLRVGYGLTEGLAVNVINSRTDFKEGSIGKPIPEAEVKILDDAGNEVPTGQFGEIVIKSKANMLGYYKDEETTSKCLKDGWLYTGDIGYVDEDGFIFYKSRAKRVVKVSGVAVFPSEVEQLIGSIPEVRQVAAIRIPDEKLQSALKVFVVADFFDETEMRRKIMETCTKYLVKWSIPKEIEFRKELPLTKLTKVDFKILQAEEDAKRDVC